MIAVLILVLAVLKVDVIISMFFSILVAFVISHLVQQVDVKQVVQSMILGYHSTNPAIAAMLDGGGACTTDSVEYCRDGAAGEEFGANG